MVDSDTDTTVPDSDCSDNTSVPSLPDSDGSDSSSVSSLSGSEGPLNIPQLDLSPAQREALWQAWQRMHPTFSSISLLHMTASLATNASQREDNDGEREDNDSSSAPSSLPDSEDASQNMLRDTPALHHAENHRIYSFRAMRSALEIMYGESF